MPSEMGEAFKAYRESRQDKRADNRAASKRILFQHRIEFEEKNDGAHLIVVGKNGLIDFWPGTSKFITRDGEKGRGVFNLLNLIKNEQEA